MLLAKVAYTAVPAALGRPRRAVTVRDAIADLPPISNGADVVEMPFSGALSTLPPTLPRYLCHCPCVACRSARICITFVFAS